ncbi:Ig-like domain-containing protein [Luteolibacter marinus]|uniref:Ig-like domain-containing protein n=1 Tax=Luteolibacter marinus TaxID=2776705 RepID=UPI0018661EFA|nr:Ig-like domain-containing protein [Luteolibacter marinus]
MFSPRAIRFPLFAAACLFSAGISCLPAQVGGLDTPHAVAPFFNGTFPVSAPGSASGWDTENAFPNLTFVDPLWLTEVPGTNDLLLVGKNGQLWRFENDPAVTQGEVVKVLEWEAKTQSSEDQGFYSLVFHPGFETAAEAEKYVYVCYNHKPALAGADSNHSFWRVSRFNWQTASGTIDPDSEYVLMNQYDRCRWHNGGAMFFDEEGYLYINCGDGGDSGEGGGLNGPDGALSRTQRLDWGLFSGVFKIDVDFDPSDPNSRSHAIRRQPQSPTNKPAGWPESYTQGYGIPNDNPWLDEGGSVLEEYHSLGLRSPHTMHYDSVSGEIWIGDVGEGSREEMTRAPKGSNAQWGYMEGTIGGPGAPAVPAIGTEEPPGYDYNRSIGTCIIGGMRYRGSKWAGQLGGKLLFGDHVRGRIWTATLDAGGGAPVVEEIVAGFHTGNKAGLANFCTDSAGEVYLMDVNGTNQAGGTIRKLTTQGISAEPPQFLSETGVFTDLSALAVAPGVIPYNVGNPLWSDAAAKQRWIILPNDGVHDSAAEKIVFSESGNWLFPAGTVLVKHFEVHPNEQDPSQVRRLETRFLVCTEGGGKYGLTYRWNAAGTDAELLTSGDVEDFEFTFEDGSTEMRHWDFPSRADCLLCHNSAAGQALGVRTYSLNRSFHYDETGRDANQLVTFNQLGMFDRDLTSQEILDFIEARPIDDESAPIEHRVRSYLDSNCSHCHRPGGPVDYFDARLGTALNVQGLINGIIQGHFSLGPDGRYLKPGDPDLSALHVRMNNVGNGAAMPPLAKNLIDQKAVDLLQEYLNSLTEEEFQTTASPDARYVRLTALSEVNGNAWTSVGEFTVLDGNGSAIPISEISVDDVDSEETVDEVAPATRAIDGNPDTFWHTEWGAFEPPPPHHLTIDLGSTRSVGGYVYTPRQGNQNGRIAGYEVHRSVDGLNWTLMDAGTWPNGGDLQRFDGDVGQRKARCQIAGPAETVPGTFDVTVVFDMEVGDFDAGDLEVSGGSVTALRGKGYYYVATISPASPQVSVSVPQDAANSDGMGSRSSSTLLVDFVDTVPPVPVFSRVPLQVTGPFQISLSFGEAVSGLESSDFVLTNATLDGITPDGVGYLLSLTPLTEGSVGVAISAGAVVDGAGLPMGPGTSVSTVYLQQVLARNAGEASYVGGGMVLVTDPAAPHGQYLWLPEGTDGNNYQLPVKTEQRAEYSFVVPRAGLWLVRGLVQSSDNSSDSFWVEIDGNQATGTINTWDTGPVGPGYVWDYLNNRNVADPVVLDLTAGGHTVTVYARDDGTRLDRLELESVRPLVFLTGPAGIVNGNFTISVEFSEPVTGLAAEDFSITGGSVTGLTGTGASYALEVAPAAGTVQLSLPENAAVDGGGAGNHVSNEVFVSYRTPYEQWAFDHGVDGSAGSQLADEDHDGIEKLLEFAFNLDPSLSDRATYDPGVLPGSGLPRLVMAAEAPGGPQLALQYLRRKGVAGLTYEPQFGATLDDFGAATGAPVVEDLGEEWERVTISDAAGAGAPLRFGRVVVTMTPP